MSAVLVDTSVWIDFLRRGNDELKALLNNAEVSTHPLVIGELHVGNIANRETFLALIDDLPRVPETSHEEVVTLIEAHKLYGKGLGYMDIHLLCASIISNIPLWTLDKRLAKLAQTLNPTT